MPRLWERNIFCNSPLEWYFMDGQDLLVESTNSKETLMVKERKSKKSLVFWVKTWVIIYIQLTIYRDQNPATLKLLLWILILCCLLGNKRLRKNIGPSSPFLPKDSDRETCFREEILGCCLSLIWIKCGKQEGFRQVSVNNPAFLSRLARTLLPSVFPALPQLPVNHPFSLLKSKIPSPLLPFSFVQKCLVYPPNVASLFGIFMAWSCLCKFPMHMY